MLFSCQNLALVYNPPGWKNRNSETKESIKHKPGIIISLLVSIYSNMFLMHAYFTVVYICITYSNLSTIWNIMSS